jgi:hypothetical protein
MTSTEEVISNDKGFTVGDTRMDPLKIWDKLEHDDEEKPAPLRSMLRNSQFVYDYASIRELVLKHDKFLTADVDEKKRNKDIVEFVTPALVVTKKSADVGHLKSAVLKHTVTLAAIIEFVNKNRHLIMEDDGGNLVLRPKEDREKDPDDFDKLSFESRYRRLLNNYDSDIWEFDDEYSSNELVFSVIVNRTEKRIVCVFRGSVTGGEDWSTNFKAFLKNFPLLETFAGDIGVHRGFGNYLFNADWTAPHEDSKFEQIVKILREIRERTAHNGDKYADYEIFVTGHSLGGALSQLLSFALAGSPLTEDLTHIQAITFASPRPGDNKFSKAYEKLERDDKLHHIRVTNSGDYVPVAPSIPFFGYSQTGLNIHVFDNKKAEIKYQNTKWVFSQVQLSNPGNMHGLTSYFERLVNEENKDLMKMSMHDLYKKYTDFVN